MQSSLFIVDSRVADIDQLLTGIRQSAQVLHIAPGENAIARISQALGAFPKGIDRLEILSHGQPGMVLLGRDRLTAEKLTQYQNILKSWGQILGQAGEIILHGCQVGAGQIGRAFVEQWHQLTGLGVAANRDLTGGDRTAGNWDFDVLMGGASGRSHLSWQARHGYGHTLATFNVTTDLDDGTGAFAGTLSKAILDANTTPGPDTIILRSNFSTYTLGNVMTRLIRDDVTITGDDPDTPTVERATISGSLGFRPFFIKSGNVTLEDLIISDSVAQGGAAGAGGAGAGMGGGLFVYDGTVTIRRVDFNNNQAIGGSDFGGGPGGGGLFGTGNLGGGGLFADASGGAGAYGGSGLYGGSGGMDNSPAPGGVGGFGGGGGYSSGNLAGDGGFGGGGGSVADGGTAGNGGFGGGGGDAGTGTSGNGGYGGGGGADSGLGGYGGADASGSGGAGAGFGGSIFVRSGNVTLDTVNFTDSKALRGGVGASGLGGAIFVVRKHHINPWGRSPHHTANGAGSSRDLFWQ